MSSVPFLFYALSHVAVFCVNGRSLLSNSLEKDANHKNTHRCINMYFCFFLVINNLQLFSGGAYFPKPNENSANLFYVLDFIHLVTLPLYIVVFGEYALRAYELIDRMPEELTVYTSRKKSFRVVYSLIAVAMAIAGLIQFVETTKHGTKLESMAGVHMYSSTGPDALPIGVVVIALSGLFSGIAIRYKTISKYNVLWALQLLDIIGQGAAVGAGGYVQIVSNLFECIFTWSVALADLHMNTLESVDQTAKINQTSGKLVIYSGSRINNETFGTTNPIQTNSALGTI